MKPPHPDAGLLINSLTALHLRVCPADVECLGPHTVLPAHTLVTLLEPNPHMERTGREDPWKVQVLTTGATGYTTIPDAAVARARSGRPRVMA